MAQDNPLPIKQISNQDHQQEMKESQDFKGRSKCKKLLNLRKLWQKPDKIYKKQDQGDKIGTIEAAVMRKLVEGMIWLAVYQAV
jgi:hypothetical protein